MSDIAAPSTRQASRRSWLGTPVEPSKTVLVSFGLAALLMVGVGAALGPVPGIGAVAAVGAGIVVIRRPIFGAYVLVCVPALSGLQRGLPVPGFRLSELLAAGVSAVILVTARQTPRWRTFDWIAFGYVVANATLVWLNVVRHGDSFTGDTLGTLLGPLQFFLLYRALLTVVRDETQRTSALRLLLLASVPVAVLTLLQTWNVGPARELIDTLAGPDATLTYGSTLDQTLEQAARATGPFPHWHNLAGFMMLTLLLGVSLLHEPAQRVMRRKALFVVLVLAFAALAQTASLAPLTGLLVGALVIALFVGQTRRTLVALGAGAVVATVMFWPLLQARLEQQYGANSVTESQTLLPDTIAFRVKVWTTEFIPVIRDNLLFGYGPNLPPRLFFPFAESVYVTFLLRGGVILLIFYLALMCSLALRSYGLAAADELGRRSVARTVFAAVILLLAIDTIASYFIDSGPAPLLWTLAGLMGYDWTRKRGRLDPSKSTSSRPTGLQGSLAHAGGSKPSLETRSPRGP